MRFSINEVAHIVEVDIDKIDEWTKIFSEYLSQDALFAKGPARLYTIEDVRVMAYVHLYWEDNLDIENIKIDLNANSQYHHELIANLIAEITPFFSEPPDNMDDTWTHGILFAGLSEIGDMFYLANSYKLAGDILIDAALKSQQAWDLFFPAVYNYRHAIELYLKALTGDNKKKHDLERLYIIFEEMIADQFKTDIPGWFKNLIVSINKFDPGGTLFRYGGNLNQDDIFIDFIQLKRLMGWLSQSFNRIRRKHGIPDYIR